MAQTLPTILPSLETGAAWNKMTSFCPLKANAAALPVFAACCATERIVGRSRGGMSLFRPRTVSGGKRVSEQLVRRRRIEASLHTRFVLKGIDAERSKS